MFSAASVKQNFSRKLSNHPTQKKAPEGMGREVAMFYFVTRIVITLVFDL